MTDPHGTPISFDKPGPSAPGPAPGYGPAQGSSYGPPGYPPPAYGAPGWAAGPPGPPHLKPTSNIGWAVAAIITFWPLAIPAFIYALRVDSQWFAGDLAGAQHSSREARKWGLIAVIVGVVMFVLVIGLAAVVFAGASSGASSGVVSVP